MVLRSSAACELFMAVRHFTSWAAQGGYVRRKSG